MTLRGRVLAYLAIAAVASCALTVGVALVLVRHQIADQRITALRNEAALLATAGGAPGALAPGTHVFRVGGARPRRVRPRLAAAILAQVDTRSGATGTVTAAGHPLLYAAAPTENGRIILIRPAHLAFGEWRPFLVSLILAGAGGALLAAILSLALARRLTRPIGQLVAATRRLAAGEAAVTVPTSGEDELATLGRSFNAMSIELERARESQRRFLESVSHELKTPLTSIRGYAEALEEEAVPASEAAGVLRAEADRLSRLVSDLLELARLGRSDFEIDLQPLDLAAVAGAAVARHRPRAHELGVELTTLNRSGGSGGAALGDEGRLLQAVSNLVENALRLTPAGGQVTVAAGAGEITVTDSGPGLAPEDIGRAFERFYLSDRYRSHREVGSGLGLAIVRELVSAMNGEVQAANRPEGGASFQIRLPPAPDGALASLRPRSPVG